MVVLDMLGSKRGLETIIFAVLRRDPTDLTTEVVVLDMLGRKSGLYVSVIRLIRDSAE